MKKILILGGGFGGLYCAKRLQKIKLNSFDIELVSDTNYFVFQPLLPEVASGYICVRCRNSDKTNVGYC